MYQRGKKGKKNTLRLLGVQNRQPYDNSGQYIQVGAAAPNPAVCRGTKRQSNTTARVKPPRRTNRLKL